MSSGSEKQLLLLCAVCPRKINEQSTDGQQFFQRIGNVGDLLVDGGLDLDGLEVFAPNREDEGRRHSARPAPAGSPLYGVYSPVEDLLAGEENMSTIIGPVSIPTGASESLGSRFELSYSWKCFARKLANGTGGIYGGNSQGKVCNASFMGLLYRSSFQHHEQVTMLCSTFVKT